MFNLQKGRYATQCICILMVIITVVLSVFLFLGYSKLNNYRNQINSMFSMSCLNASKAIYDFVNGNDDQYMFLISEVGFQANLAPAKDLIGDDINKSENIIQECHSLLIYRKNECVQYLDLLNDAMLQYADGNNIGNYELRLKSFVNHVKGEVN